jgi:hypothetical protein
MKLSFPLNMAIFVSIFTSAYSDAIRHPIPMDSATPWGEDTRRWINTMKPDRYYGKTVGGHEYRRECKKCTKNGNEKCTTRIKAVMVAYSAEIGRPF